MRRSLIVLSLLAVGFTLETVASADAADAATGRVEGVVTDPAGSVVSGVSVVAIAGGVTTSTARTGKDGRYALELPPGRYTLLFAHDRARLQRPDVDVDAGERVTVDARIRVAPGEVITIRQRPAVSKAAPPKPLEKYGAMPPPYTDEAILSDVWKRAWLILDLDATGRVTAVSFLKKAGHGLDEIAVREAKKYRFSPAKDDFGRAIPTRVAILMEWPSYFRARTLVSTGQPPCEGSGPMNLGSMHPTYRDCSVPEIPDGVTFIEPAPPPVQFFPF